MKDDFLIVGAGLYGAVFARVVAEHGRTVRLIDRRSHIGGNCYTELVDGIYVHRYGPHIFHTSSVAVWDFVTQFATFNDYRHVGRACTGNRIYSFPINLRTLKQVWNLTDDEEAVERLAAARVPVPNPRSMRDWLLSQVGPELYEMFFRGYTKKQWNRDPADLPASIAQRIPVRLTENDHYYNDTCRFEGVPTEGYTSLIANLLDHDRIDVELGEDYFARRDAFDSVAKQLVYTGKLDAFFDYVAGELDYRSLEFVEQRYRGTFQESAIVYFTDASVPFTRITEHKRFVGAESPHTIVSYEYPTAHTRENEPYYPIRDALNLSRLRKYEPLARQSKAIFGGRLGTYRYYDMDQVVAQALVNANKYVRASGARWSTRGKLARITAIDEMSCHRRGPN